MNLNNTMLIFQCISYISIKKNTPYLWQDTATTPTTTTLTTTPTTTPTTLPPAPLNKILYMDGSSGNITLGNYTFIILIILMLKIVNLV